ncbi:hypothetical protein PM082_000484 [Marasmius tenuissimus]|nr:hypothetical protein PM082_000484 [Marasmius tenuissimus]
MGTSLGRIILGPKTAIVITDASAVKELMDKRSQNSSDRPPNFIADSVTGGLGLSLAHYGDTWRTLRRTAHTILTPQMCAKHLPIQYAETTQLLFDVLHNPDGFYNHIRRFSNSVIMSVLFGKRCPRYETPETTAFFIAQHEWELLLEPGATPPLDLLPFLQKVPERWAKWKRDVRQCRKHQRDLYFGLLDETKERMDKGEDNGSYMEEVIRRQEEFGMDREMMGYLGGILLEGGSDTTSSFLHSVVLAMIAFPEAQKKAQAELDRVVGPHRLPTLDDFPELPYVQALIQETHRFRPVAPLILPHATTAPEEYKGYLIPGGSTIFVNVWGIFHDPGKLDESFMRVALLNLIRRLELYDDPDTFKPDRYLLTENGTKPGVDGSDARPTLGFGCGRVSSVLNDSHFTHSTEMFFLPSGVASLPGNSPSAKLHRLYTLNASEFHQKLTNITQNLDTMRLLWAFNLSRATDPETGKIIDVDVNDYLKGILTGPCPFKASITPRSTEVVEVIEREFHEATDTFSKFEFGLSAEDKSYLKRYRSQPSRLARQ